MSLRLPDLMPWRIYQAYLQGPSALFRLFEDAFGRQALYGPPDPDQQQRTIDALSEQVGQLKAQNERLQAEVSDLRGHNFQLQRRNAELEALVANDHASWCSFEKLIFAVRPAFSSLNLANVSGPSGNRYIFVPGSLPTAIRPC